MAKIKPTLLGGASAVSIKGLYDTARKAAVPGFYEQASGLAPELEQLRVLTTAQAATLIGLSEATLERLRYAGQGPPTVALSARRLGYRVRDLMAWLDARVRAEP
jgi:predicted DNA-binding transcriptional regulator AlpA